ncbi:MAG: sugar phosphate isomerase/epimerase [Clostridia bacterium]|nr:sugar phosphate isomerase/epimerase [Clostridia bacterium]
MKFGSCLSMKQFWTMYPVFAEFAEIPACAVANMETEEYKSLKRLADSGRVDFYSVKNLIKEYRLTGREVNFTLLKEYIEKLFYRLAELKTKLIVFGSGKVKDVEEGFSREKAWEQLFEFGAMIADEAKKYGQKIAVEPLAYSETNILNTVEEGAYYVKNVDRANFKCMVDFYHFDCNKDNYADIEKYAKDIIHIHFASQSLRKLPVTTEDWQYIEKWMGILKKIGYDGAVAFEGGIDTSENLNNTLIRLRKIAEGDI